MAALGSPLPIFVDKEATMEAFEHVKEAIPRDDYKIAVIFNGGRRGVFDCSRYLSDPSFG